MDAITVATFTAAITGVIGAAWQVGGTVIRTILSRPALRFVSIVYSSANILAVTIEVRNRHAREEVRLGWVRVTRPGGTLIRLNREREFGNAARFVPRSPSIAPGDKIMETFMLQAKDRWHSHEVMEVSVECSVGLRRVRVLSIETHPPPAPRR